MSLFRSKPILITSASVMALLLAGSIILLVRERRGAEQALRARERARSDLDRFYAQYPFPTDENVILTRTNAVQLLDWHARLSEVLRDGQIETPELSPAVFIERLNAQVNNLRRASPRVAGERVIPETFTFGFDAYLGADAALPEPEHVGRLARQLQLVRMLVEMAYDAGVMRITAVARDVFEQESEVRERAPRAAGRPTALRTVQRDTAREPLLYSRERIRITLRLRPEALSTVLNRLSHMKPLATVGFLSIRKSAPDIRPIRTTTPAPVRAPTGFPGLPVARPPTEEPVSVEEMPREQRLISGPEMDPPLDVNIEIDIYHFGRG